MSIWSITKTLDSILPINFYLPKFYVYANVNFNTGHWTRVFRENEKLCVVRMTQDQALSRQVRVRIECHEGLDEEEINNILDRVSYEVGLEERMRTLRIEAKNDTLLDLALKSNPGLRIFANSDTVETAVCAMISQNVDLITYRSILGEFLKNYGQPISWDSELYAFPTYEELIAMNQKDWLELGVGTKAEYLAGLDEDDLYHLHTYAYYPVYDRGLQGLGTIRGIGAYTARIIMIYGARRYDYAFYDGMVQELLDHMYKLQRVLPPTQFDEWIFDRWSSEPALVMHALLQDFMPAYLAES